MTPELLLHLADLHAGTAQPAASTLRAADDDQWAVVLGGDVTDDGSAAAWDAAAEWLAPLLDEAVPVAMVLGNRDVAAGSVPPPAAFDEVVRGPRVWSLDEATHVVLLETAIPGERGGRIDADGWAAITAVAELPGRRIAVLHHSLLPIPGAHLQHEVLEEAGDVLAALLGAGAQLVLTGHKHVQHRWVLDGMHVVGSGSPTPGQQRRLGEACWTRVRLDGPELVVAWVRPDGSLVDEWAVPGTDRA